MEHKQMVTGVCGIITILRTISLRLHEHIAGITVLDMGDLKMYRDVLDIGIECLVDFVDQIPEG